MFNRNKIRDFAINHFIEEKIAKEYLEVYKNLLSS